MNFLALSGLLNGIASISLAIFVISKNRDGAAHRAYFAANASVALYSVGYLLWQLAPNETAAALWFKVLFAGVILINITFVHFVLAFLGLVQEKLRFLLVCYVLNGLFIAANFASFLYSDLVPKYGYGLWPIPRPLFHVYLLFWFFLCFYGFYRLAVGFSKSSGVKKQQIKYFMLATAFGFFGGANNWPLWYNIPFPPYLNLLISLYIGIVAYAIVKHRLLEIEVVIRRAFVFASLFAFIYSVFAIATYLSQEFLTAVLGIRAKTMLLTLGVALIAIAVRPLEAFLIRVTDRALFQKKYDYQKTLKDAARGMARVTDLERLLNLISHFVSMRIRVSNVGVFYKDRFSGKFVLKAGRGPAKLAGVIELEQSSPMVAWLEEKKEVLTYDDLAHWLKHEKIFPHKTVLRKTLEDIKKQMETYRAIVCVPSFSKDKLLGFLVLGEKLSRDYYTVQDIDVLSTLSHEAAVAIENAQLYEELYQKMREIEGLYKKEKKLFINTTKALALAVDAKDRYTHGHVERVTHYCSQVWSELKEMGYKASPDFEEVLYIGALLHDVGKIGTPDSILNKKGPLTDEEFEVMKKHPLAGAEILEPITELKEASLAIKHHQERWDGKGYPDGLKGEDIPLSARIVTVADAFDAMVTDRPYRPRMLHNVAVSEMRRCAGSHFDPNIVEAFLRAYNKGKIVHFHREESKPQEPARQPEAAQGQDLTQPSSHPKSDDMEGPGLAAAS